MCGFLSLLLWYGWRHGATTVTARCSKGCGGEGWRNAGLNGCSVLVWTGSTYSSEEHFLARLDVNIQRVFAILLPTDVACHHTRSTPCHGCEAAISGPLRQVSKVTAAQAVRRLLDGNGAHRNGRNKTTKHSSCLAFTSTTGSTCVSVSFALCMAFGGVVEAGVGVFKEL